MESLLIKLILIVALLQLGLSLSDFRDCHSRQCLAKIEQKSRDILRIDWKPISVFPEEGRRFR